MKRGIVGAVLLALVTVVGSSQVVDPANVMGDDVIGLRKNVMRSIGAQFGALRGAVGSGDLDAIHAAGLTISALAGVLPILFEEEHADMYPYGDSPIHYEAGDDAVLFRNAQALQAAGLAAAQASSASVVDVRALGGTCAACHRGFRRGG